MRYVALLRGIGPNNPNMHAKNLAAAFTKMGFKNVASVISSGNVVFDSALTDSAKIEKKIEAALPKLLKFKSTTIVRSREELEKFVANKPYKTKTHSREYYTLVTFLKNHSTKVRTFPRKGPGFEVVAKYKKEMCSVIDLKHTHTPEFMGMLEKALSKDITNRTYGTVLRILKKM